MAAEKVFDTTELVEWIILELDFKDILEAKAISRKCKATIEGSAKIKRKLFLLADGDPILPLPAAKGIDRFPGHESESILFNNFRDFEILGGCAHSSLAWLWITPLLTAVPRTVLPLFEHCNDTPDEDKESWTYSFTTRRICTSRSTFSWPKDHVKDLKHLKLPMSYRPMFLSQPPVTAVLLEPGSITVYNRDGVTLGMIADMFARIGEQWDDYMRFTYEDLELDHEKQQAWREHLSKQFVRAAFRLVKDTDDDA